MLFLLLSVFFQSYVAQTHIHGAGQALTQITAQDAAHAPQAPLPQDDDDHGNCLLCQAALHSGAVMVPAVLAVLLPALLFLGLAEASQARVSLPVLASHAWRSRAPPRS